MCTILLHYIAGLVCSIESIVTEKRRHLVRDAGHTHPSSQLPQRIDDIEGLAAPAHLKYIAYLLYFTTHSVLDYIPYTILYSRRVLIYCILYDIVAGH